jgi:hypothetical protein
MAQLVTPNKRRSFFLIPVLVLTGAVIGGTFGPTTQTASAASGDDDISASLRDFTQPLLHRRSRTSPIP